MKYQIGDKFYVQGVECEVRYINNLKAWVAPLEDIELPQGGTHVTCVTFEVLDEKGRDTKGNKAKSIVNRQSLAV